MPSSILPARIFPLLPFLGGVVFLWGCSSGVSSPPSPPAFRVGVLRDGSPLSRSIELGVLMASSEISQGLDLVFLPPTSETFPSDLDALIVAPGIFLPFFHVPISPQPLLLVPAPPAFLSSLSALGTPLSPPFPPLPITDSSLWEIPLLFIGTSQRVEATLSARFLMEFSLPEIVVLHPSTPWGRFMFSAFNQTIPNPGPIVKPVTYPAESTSTPLFDPGEFAGAVTPWALYLVATPEDIPMLFSSLSGILPPSTILLLSSTCGEPELLPPSPILPGHTFRIAPRPATTVEGQLFAQEFERRYGIELDLGSAYGYDALFLLGLSFASKPTLSPQERWREILNLANPSPEERTHPLYPLDFSLGVKYLEKGEGVNYEGVSGSLIFAPSGERRDGYFTIYKGEAVDGKLRFTPWVTRAVEVPSLP